MVEFQRIHGDRAEYRLTPDSKQRGRFWTATSLAPMQDNRRYPAQYSGRLRIYTPCSHSEDGHILM